MSEEHGPDEVWTTRSGEQIKVGDLSEEHAKNILRMILKEERERKEALVDSLSAVNEIISMIRGVGSELHNMPRVIILDSEDDECETTMDDINYMFRKHGAAED